MLFCIIIIGIIISIFYLTSSPFRKEISYETFLADLSQNKIEKVEYNPAMIIAAEKGTPVVAVSAGKITKRY